MTGAVYLYCLARSHGLPAISGAGVDGESPLCLHGFGAVTAVLSTVQLDEFCGPEAESRLQDLAWVAPRAFRHEAVVEEAMEHSPVFPIPFGTIFSSLASLEAFLGTHHDTIVRFLEQMHGREEWAVKGLLDPTQAPRTFFAAALEGALPDHAALPPGKRYLAEKRLLGRAEKAMQAWLHDACKELADDLSRLGTDFRQRQVLSRQASGLAADMIVNWVLLLPQALVGEVQARIERANADYRLQGLHFQLSGPWPPYSFRPPLASEPQG